MLPRLALPLAILFAAGPAFGAVPKTLGTFDDWSAWTYQEGGREHCYIYSSAASKAPARLDHGDVSFFVRTIDQGTEANFKVGYDFAPGSTVRADIGDDSFKLMVNGPNAWLPTAGQEDDLLAAMKGGDEMSIHARSRRGNETTYIFSLDGVTAAIRQIQKECR